jgi:hypothetical protein
MCAPLHKTQLTIIKTQSVASFFCSVHSEQAKPLSYSTSLTLDVYAQTEAAILAVNEDDSGIAPAAEQQEGSVATAEVLLREPKHPAKGLFPDVFQSSPRR